MEAKSAAKSETKQGTSTNTNPGTNTAPRIIRNKSYWEYPGCWVDGTKMHSRIRSSSETYHTGNQSNNTNRVTRLDYMVRKYLATKFPKSPAQAAESFDSIVTYRGALPPTQQDKTHFVTFKIRIKDAPEEKEVMAIFRQIKADICTQHN